jgi:hypothetical protein
MNWAAERISNSREINPVFTACCSKDGAVQLPALRPLPDLLHRLFTTDTSTARHFRTHIRKYNSALAFASVKYTPDTRVAGGLQCFQIHGALYHTVGPLEHEANVRPQCAQIFLYDPEDAMSRLRISAGGVPLPQDVKVCDEDKDKTVFLMMN